MDLSYPTEYLDTGLKSFGYWYSLGELSLDFLQLDLNLKCYIYILQHKRQLLLLWLTWCLGGLIFDVVYVLWWLWELISGDTIEALTNILISMITTGKLDIDIYANIYTHAQIFFPYSYRIWFHLCCLQYLYEFIAVSRCAVKQQFFVKPCKRFILIFTYIYMYILQQSF